MSTAAFRWPFETAGKAVPAQAVAAAWHAYRATGSEAGRETLLQRYIHLVRYMASRLARTFPASVETEDLVSAGVVLGSHLVNAACGVAFALIRLNDPWPVQRASGLKLVFMIAKLAVPKWRPADPGGARNIYVVAGAWQ